MNNEKIRILFLKYYAPMVRQAVGLIYDYDESRDIVSEVFASLISMPTEPDNIEAYLMTSVRNRCISIIRHKDVRQRFLEAYTSDMQTVAQPQLDDDRLAGVMTFIEKEMSVKTKEVFRLRHIEGLKYQEIADLLGISRVMVYKHLGAATMQIREFIKKIK